MLKKYFVFFVLCAVFSISVLIRFNQITPVVKSHEQTYILTLQTSEIWREAGLLNCHLTPMWTYNNPGDKYIAYYKRLEDQKGNNYYVSFPPLSFLVAHLALYPFNIESGKLVLQILNILLHFISAYFIYLIICSLYNQKQRKFFFPAFISFVVYSFLPVMLFFHTDIFFPEMIGQVLWIISIYFVLKYKENIGFKSGTYIFIVLFLFLYAEWIAVFFVFTIFLYLFISKSLKINKSLFIIASAALFSAGLILFIQYSSITGINEMLHSMGIRYLERSGFFGPRYSSMGVHILSFDSLKLFALNLNKALTVIGYIIIVLFFILFFRKKYRLNINSKFVLVLSFLPVLIHWIVFFNANAIHLLLMARIAVPLCILVGISSYTLLYDKQNILLKKLFPLFLIVFLFYSAIVYQKKFTFNEKFPELKKVAETIKETVKPNQSVFINCDVNIPEPEKYLTFISKRNIVNVYDEKQAEKYMIKKGKKGDIIVFEINKNAIISNILFLKNS